MQEFHALVTRNFREQHFGAFYADKLAISEQYLARNVWAGTGKSVNGIINTEQTPLNYRKGLLI